MICLLFREAVNGLILTMISNGSNLFGTGSFPIR